MADGKPVATLAFDLDGTLCTNTFGEYDRAEPHPRAIARVNRLARDGYRIVVFTARGSATGIDWDETTRGQLERWGVSYDELRFGKPSADVYIDDRAVHTESWLRADAFTAPGFPLGAGDGLPPAPNPSLTAITEVGRTFSGVPLNLDAHAAHAVARAQAAGLHGAPAATEIVDRVESRLGAVPRAAADDLVYTIVIAAGEAQRIELDQPAATEQPRATLAVAVRPLSELVEAGMLEIQSSVVAVAAGGRLLLPEPAFGPVVMIDWIETIARGAGIDVGQHAAVEDGVAAAAEEAMLIGIPHCVLPLDGAAGGRLPAGPAGSVAERLLAAVSETAGVEPLAQLRGLSP